MSDTIRKRIEQLEANQPQAVLLTLDDGTVFRYPEGALALYCAIVAQVYDFQTGGKEGPLIEIARRAVRSEGFGPHMLELAKCALAPYQKERE